MLTTHGLSVRIPSDFMPRLAEMQRNFMFWRFRGASYRQPDGSSEHHSGLTISWMPGVPKGFTEQFRAFFTRQPVDMGLGLQLADASATNSVSRWFDVSQPATWRLTGADLEAITTIYAEDAWFSSTDDAVYLTIMPISALVGVFKDEVGHPDDIVGNIRIAWSIETRNWMNPLTTQSRLGSVLDWPTIASNYDQLLFSQRRYEFSNGQDYRTGHANTVQIPFVIHGADLLMCSAQQWPDTWPPRESINALSVVVLCYTVVINSSTEYGSLLRNTAALVSAMQDSGVLAPSSGGLGDPAGDTADQEVMTVAQSYDQSGGYTTNVEHSGVGGFFHRLWGLAADALETFEVASQFVSIAAALLAKDSANHDVDTHAATQRRVWQSFMDPEFGMVVSPLQSGDADGTPVATAGWDLGQYVDAMRSRIETFSSAGYTVAPAFRVLGGPADLSVGQSLTEWYALEANRNWVAMVSQRALHGSNVATVWTAEVAPGEYVLEVLDSENIAAAFSGPGAFKRERRLDWLPPTTILDRPVSQVPLAHGVVAASASLLMVRPDEDGLAQFYVVPYNHCSGWRLDTAACYQGAEAIGDVINDVLENFPIPTSAAWPGISTIDVSGQVYDFSGQMVLMADTGMLHYGRVASDSAVDKVAAFATNHARFQLTRLNGAPTAPLYAFVDFDGDATAPTVDLLPFDEVVGAALLAKLGWELPVVFCIGTFSVLRGNYNPMSKMRRPVPKLTFELPQRPAPPRAARLNPPIAKKQAAASSSSAPVKKARKPASPKAKPSKPPPRSMVKTKKAKSNGQPLPKGKGKAKAGKKPTSATKMAKRDNAARGGVSRHRRQ